MFMLTVQQRNKLEVGEARVLDVERDPCSVKSTEWKAAHPTELMVRIMPIVSRRPV